MLFGIKIIPAGHLHIQTACVLRCWEWEL